MYQTLLFIPTLPKTCSCTLIFKGKKVKQIPLFLRTSFEIVISVSLPSKLDTIILLPELSSSKFILLQHHFLKYIYFHHKHF